MKRMLLALLALVLAGCFQPQESSPSQSEPQTEGSCRITITNPSQSSRTISIVSTGNKVIVEGNVPALNKEPPVWKMVNADISGKDIVVTVDKNETKVSVGTDTVELVIGLGLSGQSITQHTKRRQWR